MRAEMRLGKPGNGSSPGRAPGVFLVAVPMSKANAVSCLVVPEFCNQTAFPASAYCSAAQVDKIRLGHTAERNQINDSTLPKCIIRGVFEIENCSGQRSFSLDNAWYIPGRFSLRASARIWPAIGLANWR